MKSWPITLTVPWGLTPFPPPLYMPLPAKIRMEILDPIRFRSKAKNLPNAGGRPGRVRREG